MWTNYFMRLSTSLKPMVIVYFLEVEGYKRKVEGGAMQITLHKVHLDFYPFHAAGRSDCSC